jgi:hypothetical protein
MTTDEISKHVREVAALEERFAELHQAPIRYPTSQDLWRQETALAKHWNRLVSELKTAGVEGYEPKLVTEEKPRELTWIQLLFVESGLDIRDLTRPDPKPRQSTGDGLD